VTLVELLVALALIAALAGLLAPAGRATLDEWRAWGWQRELISGLDRARTRARAYGEAVTLCGGEPATGCDPGGWGRGWFLARDPEGVVRGGAPPDADAILEQGRGGGAGADVAAGFHVRRGVRFEPERWHVPNGTFTLCRSGEAVRGVVLSNVGRVRAGEGNSSDCP